MDIILREDCQNVGNKNDIVSVKTGFARNYLIPRGLAIVATESARKVVGEVIRQQTSLTNLPLRLVQKLEKLERFSDL
jgi:large subunit ribosomal protein L9